MEDRKIYLRNFDYSILEGSLKERPSGHLIFFFSGGGHAGYITRNIIERMMFENRLDAIRDASKLCKCKLKGLDNENRI